MMQSPRSGRQPEMMENLSLSAIARFARLVFLPDVTWGSTSLHPRLYALTRYAGLEKISPLT